VQILNQIGFTYPNLELSVGLHGHLQFASVTDNTKQLNKVLSEEKVEIEFLLVVCGFDCNSAVLCLSFANSYSVEEIPSVIEGYEKHGEIIEFPKTLTEPYIFNLSEFLLPLKYTTEEFLNKWSRFPVGFILDLIFDINLDQMGDITSHLATTPFHQVTKIEFVGGHYFQLAYSAMTWFEDQLLFTITENKSTLSPVVSARFEFRASKLSVLNVFHQQIDLWIKSWLKIKNPQYNVLRSPPTDIFCETSGELVISCIEGTQAKEMLQKWAV